MLIIVLIVLLAVSACTARPPVQPASAKPQAGPVLNPEVTFAKERARTAEIRRMLGEKYAPCSKRIPRGLNPFRVKIVPPRDLNPDIRPTYTKEAVRRGVSGAVYMSLTIDKTGKVLRACPRGRALGYGLAERARYAYYQKHFRPATYQGKPVRVTVIVPIRFTFHR